MLSATRDDLVNAQKSDPTLRACFSAVVTRERADVQPLAYFLEKGVLLRKWSSHQGPDTEWSTVVQVVVPTLFRPQVLSLAHDTPWSAHLGVTKTHNRVLQHFFWPGLKGDVARHCRTCHTCQLMGKPNQVILPAPLHPIPVMGEPFEKVIGNGPTQSTKTRSRNQYLLTVMCAATRYPEAIPLRNITTKVVVAALLKFFSTFGLPKEVQTDQGTNFTANLFAQVLKTLYHTQGVQRLPPGEPGCSRTLAPD